MSLRPGFEYHSGRSTSHIIFYDYNATLRVLNLRPIPFDPLVDVDNPQQFTICSSSHGLVACRNRAAKTYYVNNPGCRKHLLPPCDIHRNNGYVVLGFDSPFALVSSAGIREGNYIIHAYNYRHDFCWYTSPAAMFRRQTHGPIVPHSGVTFGREAFWILRGSKWRRSSLLRFIGDPLHPHPPVSILNLPPFPGLARMQLGRAMGRLGLVIVNQTNSTVALFTLRQSGWHRRLVFNVEISRPQQPAVDADGDQETERNVASWRRESNTLVCREMPRPIRFDSFKVELLFWVQGRVLVLENGDTHSYDYQLRVIPHRNVPASITDGIPHVFTVREPGSWISKKRLLASCFTHDS